MPDSGQIAKLRDAYAAFNRGEIEQSYPIFDPQVELIQPTELPGARGTYRGIDGLAHALGELLEGFEEYRMEPEEFFEAGNQVAVVVRLRARGRASKITVDARVGHLATLRNGRVVRWEVFMEADDAVARARRGGAVPSAVRRRS